MKMKNVAIEETVHTELKMRAAAIKKPLQEAATEACAEWIKRHVYTSPEPQQEQDQSNERAN